MSAAGMKQREPRTTQKKGSLGRFIVECLERKEGSSGTLGAIYLHYLQWHAPEAEQLGTARATPGR